MSRNPERESKFKPAVIAVGVLLGVFVTNRFTESSVERRQKVDTSQVTIPCDGDLHSATIAPNQAVEFVRLFNNQAVSATVTNTGEELTVSSIGELTEPIVVHNFEDNDAADELNSIAVIVDDETALFLGFMSYRETGHIADVSVGCTKPVLQTAPNDTILS